jgi:xylose dehydrogenase (NAD/NADP)
MKTANSTILKWGLLSTARINRQLIPAIRAAERAELVAVASRDKARAEAYAAEWGIPRAHRSYQALLDDPEIHAVYISLPNGLHAEWTVKAAQAGKHVLCEKPLAVTVDEVDQIIAAAEANSIVVMEAVMYLYHPLLHKARQLVRDGAVGQVKLARGAFSVFLDRPDDVRWQPELGGGSLWDVGSYPVSFIRCMVGEPDQVFGWSTLSESGVDETFAGLLRYEDGVLGLFDCSFRQPFRVEAQVVGAEGTLTVERPFPINAQSRIVLCRESGVRGLRGRRRLRGAARFLSRRFPRVAERVRTALRSLSENLETEVITLPEADPYRCQVDALTAAVLDGADSPVPLTSSRANVATLVGLYESARRGVPVRVARP